MNAGAHANRTRLLIPHRVAGDAGEVFARFTRELFELLAPSFPPARLLRYDGNRVGDLVEIRLGIGPVGATWVSEITEHVVEDARCWFVDEGRRLPPPLTYWRHKHLIEQEREGEVVITEDITFAAGPALLTRAMRPLIRRQFEARGPAYRAYFGAPPAG